MSGNVARKHWLGRDAWPDWQESGRRVEIELADGLVIAGELQADDFFFDGKDEVPIFSVLMDDGSRRSFADIARWRVVPDEMVQLKDLGGICGYERRDGSPALASWRDETVRVWANFDCDPYSVPMAYMRKHMVSAIPFSDKRPKGFIWVICFIIP